MLRVMLLSFLATYLFTYLPGRPLAPTAPPHLPRSPPPVPTPPCRYAPEHLIVNVEDAESWLPLLDNAGSVFLGRYTPESVGDYASGTNHVLPTYGYARMYSGVSLESFQKKMTVQSVTLEGLRLLGPSVAKMAAVEGLDAHRRAVTLRLGLSSPDKFD